MLLPSLEICSSSNVYRVEFPDIASLSEWIPEVDLLMVDDFFDGRLHPSLADRTLFVKANESAKSFEKMGDLLVELKRRGINRDSVLLGLGGGVIQDIVTFLASIYMRGIAWIYVPSTLLAMADSCLGGKSSINVAAAKNLVGTFHPPREIALITSLARSLPLVEIRGGMAEAAKICFCHGMESFRTYLTLAGPILDGSWTDQQLASLLHHVLSVKKWFIETDEFDKAERRLLNFGHTWGHALESATNYEIPHGIAVAIGMLAATHYVNSPPLLDDLSVHSRALLANVLTAEQLQTFSPERFVEAFRADKKHGRQRYSVIVPVVGRTSPGLGVEERSIPRHADAESAVLHAMSTAIQELAS